MATRLSKKCRVAKVPSDTYPPVIWRIRCCAFISTLGSLLIQGWRAIRHLSGDDAYERYLKHHAGCNAGSAPLSPKEYFVRHQLQKWHGIKRCC